MDVQINQARANQQAVHVQAFDLGGGLAGGIRAERGDLAVQNEQISNGVEVVGGSDYSPAGEEQRVHAPGAYTLAN